MSPDNFNHVWCEQCSCLSLNLKAFDNCPPDHRRFAVSMTGERTPLNIPPLLSQFPAIKKALEKAVVAAIGVPPATFGEARAFSHYKCDSCGAKWGGVLSGNDACPDCGQKLKAVFVPYNAAMPTNTLTVADLVNAKAKLDEATKAHATPCCICGALSHKTVCADCRTALAQQAEATMKNPPPPPQGTTPNPWKKVKPTNLDGCFGGVPIEPIKVTFKPHLTMPPPTTVVYSGTHPPPPTYTTPLAVMDALKKGEISAAKATALMRELLGREKATKQTPKPPEPEQPKKLRKLRVEE